MNVTAAIETHELTKRFGSFTAVDRLTMEVHSGEIFGFLGSNGAGKSTAIRMMCGLLSPTSGSARVLGLDVASQPDEVKRKIGYMSQRFSLYDDLTVEQNLTFFGGVYGLDDPTLRKRRSAAVEMAGLTGKEKILTGDLPQGWKQRLALASAVLHRPKLLFLDEPTGGVDPISRRQFWGWIDELAASGVTIVVTTHYLDEAERCDRLALMHAGCLISMGTVGELRGIFADRTMIEISSPRYLELHEKLRSEPGIREATLFGTSLHVVIDRDDASLAALRARLDEWNFAPYRISPIVPSLEDVFIHQIDAVEGRR
ncbi:MAG: ABC transporter ATP-binding protein [Pseudomonadota bacterium]